MPDQVSHPTLEAVIEAVKRMTPEEKKKVFEAMDSKQTVVEPTPAIRPPSLGEKTRMKGWKK